MFRLAMSAVLLGAAALPAQGLGVFSTLTNDAKDNRVQVAVSFFGRTYPLQSYSTGGQGTAAGLGSQAALAATRHWLVAVNAGSDDVTLFRRWGPAFLHRSDVADTGGKRPTSVDIRGDLVYVLNADSDDVTGFRIHRGSLQLIGRYALSGAGVAAAQVGFDPTGRHVVVTERGTNQILVFPVQGNGGLGKAKVTRSAAPTPFGFQFRRDGTLVVSEAAGGQAGLGAVTSYHLNKDGSLTTISAGVKTTQTASCWVAIPRDGRTAYTTNTGSSTVTGLALDHAGKLSLLDPKGVSGTLRSGAKPIDFAFDNSGRLMFVLDSGNDEVVTFWRDRQGALHLLPGSLKVPAGAAGVIAW